MSLIRRLVYCLLVLAIGCASTAVVMSLADPTLFALTVHIGYCSGLVMSSALAIALFVCLTSQGRRSRAR